MAKDILNFNIAEKGERMDKKKTLMITGASGFVGSNFIKEYGEEYNIIPVSIRENKPEELDYSNVDCILHLAALVHQMKGAPDEKYFEVNTELTRRLAEAAKAKGVKHFVFYSTVKVYGYDGDLYNHDFVLTEASPCTPNDPYGASKYEAEKILRSMEDENFKVAVIRPPMVYGPGVKGNMLNLIKLVDKFPILPFNYDENRRSIVYIGNLLLLTDKVIRNEKQGIFIPQDESTVSIEEIIEGIAKGLGKKRALIKFPENLYNFLCNKKRNIMVRLYGTLAFENKNDNDIKNKFTTEAGIKNMIEWYRR